MTAMRLVSVGGVPVVRKSSPRPIAVYYYTSLKDGVDDFMKIGRATTMQRAQMAVVKSMTDSEVTIRKALIYDEYDNLVYIATKKYNSILIEPR